MKPTEYDRVAYLSVDDVRQEGQHSSAVPELKRCKGFMTKWIRGPKVSYSTAYEKNK